MHKTVTFTIDGKGNIAVDMEGFEGKGCGDLQEQITAALDGKVTQEEIKPEYHLDNQNGNTISNRG
jgi:hypothetical protein